VDAPWCASRDHDHVRQAIRQARAAFDRQASRGNAGVKGVAMPAAMNPLQAGDLVLEPLTAAHAEAMFAVLSDPAIYEYENAPPPSADWLRTRYARLESRTSADGTEQWLNWVVRLPDGTLIGYVQATVHADASAAIAYELGSAWWGRGYARRAVGAMLEELAQRYGVRTFTAVLKRANLRSLHLLERLDFSPSARALYRRHGVEADERMMQRDARGT
jgi:RimJ/RimL family protein N-acetyltransferase